MEIIKQDIAIESIAEPVEAPAEQEVVEQQEIEPAAEEAIEETTQETQEEVTPTESSWFDNLPEELKESSYLAKFKDKSLNDVLKSAVNAQALIGKKIEDFSKEEIEGFYGKLGKPESPEGYKFAEELGEDAVNDFRQAFHQANLTQEQAKNLSDQFIMAQRATQEAQAKEIELKMVDVKNELMKEFGSAYDQRIQLATKAIKDVGGEDLLKAINESGLGYNSNVIKSFAKLGMELGESKIVDADRASAFGVSPEEAKSEIDALKADTRFMDKYYARNGVSRNSEEHKDAVARMRQLFSKAYT